MGEPLSRARDHRGHRPSLMVDAQPVRDHVRTLQRAGLGWKRIAEMAGVSYDPIRRLLRGTRGAAPAARLSHRVAHAILAVRPDQIPERGWVLAVGSRRRLQALAFNGWSGRQLVAGLGVSRPTFQRIIGADAGVRIDARTARAVRVLYDRLWDVDPAAAGVGAQSVRQTKARAAALGWVPPMAWDDDEIDDPAAAPDMGARVLRYVAISEDAADLARQGLNPRQQAERLGITERHLSVSRERAAGRELALTEPGDGHG